MAYNQYNQRSQAQPYGGQYQPQAQSNGWPNGGQQYYGNGYKQNGQNYGDWNYSQTGQQYDYYVDPAQYEQDAYHQAPQDYSQPEGQYYDQYQRNQQYQYDPRYRSQGQDSSGQAERRQAPRERNDQGKRRPEQMDLNKTNSKPQERILPTVESPVVIAWDSPFPVFNTKKKDAKKKHSSLDKKATRGNVPGQLDQRPQTSQSHRRADESRPHTSHGHRKAEPQLNSHGPPPSQPISPRNRQEPMQNNSTRAPPNQRNFSDGQTPIRPPLNHSGSDRPAARFQGEPAPHLEPLQRSMAMQDEATTGQVMKKLQKDKPDQNSGPAWGNRDGPQEPYSYAPAPISPVPVPPTVEQTSRAAISPSEAVRNELISPNMPNFDAISPSTNERSEDPLHLQANTTKPAYQKAAYKPQVAATSLPRSQSQPDFQRGPPTQPDFAGFTFDLPIVGNNNPQMNQPGIQPDSNPASPNTYSARAPMGGPSNQVRSQSGAEQHPPRSASRQGYQQYGSVSNAERYGSPNIQQTQFRSGSRTQQNPVRTQNQWGGSEISYDYGQEAFSPHRGPQGEPAGKSDQRPSQDSQRFYQDQRQYSAPVHIRQGSLDALQQQRMQIPDSGHPIPARQHEARNNSSSVNPDALPAHPVPVRPGLLQKTSTASAPTIGASRAANGPSATNPNLTPTTSREEKSAPITAYDLNLLVQTIKSNPNDHKTMLTLAKKLVEAASVLANEGGKADAKTTQKNRERYIFDAHKYLKKLVQQGYAEAMFYLAECHGQGSLGLKVDAKEAFNLYTSAAKAGYAQAAYRVAVCCEMGHEEGGGTRRDPLKAMQWYRRAASMGDTPAMYKLGIILLKGLLGQPRNLRDALSWLKRAAERADEENPHALHELGMLYENASPSDSVVKDENYARQLFTQAAELGYKFSQFRLGSAYEYGMLGCPIDPRQSLAWYTRAASQGEHQSELALSGWYLTGADGVNLKQSDTEAYLWAKKAASSGLAKAEYAMGYFTETGIGCTANLDEAKKWYWRASAQNLPKARQRLEDLKRGGGKINKTRVSRSAMNRQNEGECSVM